MPSIKELTKEIADISKCEMKKIHNEFKNQNSKDSNLTCIRDDLSTGTNEKESYAWFDVIYKGTNYTISSVWMDVNEENFNIRHYFGQISFTKNQYKYDDKSLHPNKCCTTVSQLLERAKHFQKFLNSNNYQTMNQDQGKRPFTIDNLREGNIKDFEIVDLFIQWANSEYA